MNRVPFFEGAITGVCLGLFMWAGLFMVVIELWK